MSGDLSVGNNWFTEMIKKQNEEIER